MENSNAFSSIDWEKTGLIIGTLTKTASELIKEGYIKLDDEALACFSPAIGLIENIGLHSLSGNPQSEKLKEMLKGAYICMIDNKIVDPDVLAKVKDNPELRRAFKLGKDGIEKNATLKSIDPNAVSDALGNAAGPTVVAALFMAMSLATSQYYLHEINSNYEFMCIEIESIKEQFMIQDDSEIIAAHTTVANMVNHFDSIIESPTRRQNESISLRQVEFDALKQIERSRLKIEKGYSCNPQKDATEKVESNVNGIINVLAQLKTSVYVYGMAKGLRVCFDEVKSQDEVLAYINEISDQITKYQETVQKTIDRLNDYIAASKSVEAVSLEDYAKIAPIGFLAGPFGPGITLGYSAYKLKEKDRRNAKLDSIGEQIKERVSLGDVDVLKQSVSFLEDYASTLDPEFEIVKCDDEYYIRTNKDESDKGNEEE